jgi:hypothetical protein
MATGRTPDKYIKVTIEDNGGVMRDIPCNEIGGIGINYAEQDVSALQEALTSVLNGQGSFSTTISGPFDNKVAVAESGSGARPALSGSHTVLSAMNGVQTPRSIGFYFGIQGDWATNDPVFGGIDCILVSGYTVDKGKYSAKIATAGNRTNDPAWGTALIAASS